MVLSLRLLLAVILLPLAAVADETPIVTAPRVTAGTALFIDGMDTTIWTPTVSASATVPGSLTLSAAWKADVITSASVDVVTAATTNMTELRNEASLTAERQDILPNLDINASYIYSRENDAESHVGTVGIVRELDDDNLLVGLSYGGSYNRLGMVGQHRGDFETLWVHNADVSLGRVLDRRTMLELVISGLVSAGYQENPYRRVPIVRGPDLRSASWLPELLPDRRLRGAGTMRLRHAFGSRWASSLEYRLYVDDWGMIGHTEAAELSFEPRRDLVVRLRERGTLQSGAKFYRERYDNEGGSRTRDRRLSPHTSMLAGLSLSWELGRLGPFEHLDVRGSCDAIVWDYGAFLRPALSPTGLNELEPLGWVTATVVQVGSELSW